jgi:mannosyltransferase
MQSSPADNSHVGESGRTGDGARPTRALGTGRQLTLILVFAAGLRLYGLADESLWLDEGHTINRITNSYLGMLRDSHVETQAPLYYWLNKAWCDVFGLSEYALRFPSLIFGVLGVWMIYLVGRTMFDRQAGALAALLLAVNPFALHFSQEARTYSLFMLGYLASVYFLVRLMRRFRPGDAIGYVLSTLAVLYCHAFGPFILPLQVVGFAVYWWSGNFEGARRQWDLLLLTFVVLMVLFMPQLMQLVNACLAKASGKGSAQWIPVPDFYAILYTLKRYFAWGPLAVAVLGLAGVGALGGIVADRRARPHLLFLLATPVCFLLVPWLVSRTVTPVFNSKYTCPSMPALILALAWGLSTAPAVARRAIIAVLLLMTVLPLSYYYTKVDKDPFRQAAEIVRGQVESGDVVLLNPGWTRRVFGYYFTPPPGVRLETPAGRARLDVVLLDAKRVWEVRSYASEHNAISAGLDARAPVEAVVHVNDQLDVNPLANFVKRITIVRRSVRTTGPRDRPDR